MRMFDGSHPQPATSSVIMSGWFVWTHAVMQAVQPMHWVASKRCASCFFAIIFQGLLS